MRVINIKKLIKNKMTAQDILINELDTYPQTLIKQMARKDFCADDFLNYFYKHNIFNIIGVHYTRLFDYEIEDILANGLHSDESADYALKIQRMPKEFDNYKPALLKYTEHNKRSDGNVYFDIGRIELSLNNSSLLRNWGGETLYCYYDSLNCANNAATLADRLRHLTHPCLVLLKINAYHFFSRYMDYDAGLIDYIHNGQIQEYADEFRIEPSEVEVIDVVLARNLMQY